MQRREMFPVEQPTRVESLALSCHGKQAGERKAGGGVGAGVEQEVEGSCDGTLWERSPAQPISC